MSNDSGVNYGKTPEGEEPDLVKGMTNMMRGAGMANDIVIATKIYADFKFRARTTCTTHEEIVALLQVAILDCERKIGSLLVRNQVLKKFQVMKQRVEEFVENPFSEEPVCPKCNLAKFICICGQPDIPQ